MDLLSGANIPKQAIYILGSVLLLSFGYFHYISNQQENDQQQQNQDKIQKKPAGIYNAGNTCFVNSLLQALSSIQLFRQNISQILMKQNHKSQDQQLLKQLVLAIQKINSNTESINIRNLLYCLSIRKDNLINLEQQDAHQLYSVITQCIQNILDKKKNINLSTSFNDDQQDQFQNLLQGYTKSWITCLECKTQNNITIDVFYALSLEIQPLDITNLGNAIKWFQRQQLIQGWICAQCSINFHINKLKNKTKYLKGPHRIHLTQVCQDFIKYLKCISAGDNQLKEINERFTIFADKYIKQYKKKENIDSQVLLVFQHILPISRKIIKQTKITKYPKIFVIHFKQLSINSYGSPKLLRKSIHFPQNFQIELRSEKRQYQLTSLLTHVGNQQMGHYFTFRKINKKQKDWFMISDELTKKCIWQNVQKYAPYMLFYQAQ